MACNIYTDEYFFEYAIDLYNKTGHTVTTNPEFINHSSDQFIFFDCKRIQTLTKNQRSLLKVFNNVSHLFTSYDCIFFSIVLQTNKICRSQAAHDIHSLIHSGVDNQGSICMFKCDKEVMISFMGFGIDCILSDWFPMEDDYDELLQRLHIANISIENNSAYFFDIVYSLARRYYLTTNATPYDLVPLTFFSFKSRDDIDRDELNDIIRSGMLESSNEYGFDYVEYSDSDVINKKSTTISELDLMFLDIEFDEDNTENRYSEFDNMEETYDPLENNYEIDEYEFDNIDPELFNDPALLVKFIQNSNTMPVSIIPNSEDDIEEKLHTNNSTEDDFLLNYLNEKGISYIDNRVKGGPLWIVGGHEIDDIISELGNYGYHFRFTEKGGKATASKPGWYLPNER